MKILLLIGVVFSFWFSSNISLADTPIPNAMGVIEQVPVISIDTFQPHKAWTWAYYTKDSAFYSSERYEVLSVTGSVVILEMASRFKEGAPLRAHHRLHVDVSRCLGAYAKANFKKPWAFKMYYWDGTRWTSVGSPPSTAAFEEKFNCDPNVVKTVQQETQFGLIQNAVARPELNAQKVFQQLRRKQNWLPWFFLEGNQAGIAAQRFAELHEQDYGYLMLFLGESQTTSPTPVLGPGDI